MSQDTIKSATVILETESGETYNVKLDDVKREAFQRATGCTIHEAPNQKSILLFWKNETIKKNIIPKLPKIK